MAEALWFVGDWNRSVIAVENHVVVCVSRLANNDRRTLLKNGYLNLDTFVRGRNPSMHPPSGTAYWSNSRF